MKKHKLLLTKPAAIAARAYQAVEDDYTETMNICEEAHEEAGPEWSDCHGREDDKQEQRKSIY